MTIYCAKCGNGDADSAEFCTKCGTPHAKATDVAQGIGASASAARVVFSATDRQVLGKLKMFGLLGVVAEVLGMIIPLSLGFGSAFMTGGSPAAMGAMAGTFGTVIAVGIAGMVIGIVAFFMLISALRLLSRENKSQFGTPLKMVWGLLAGLVLEIVAFAVLGIGMASAMTANPYLGYNPNSPFGQNANPYAATGPAFGATLGIFAIAGIALLIGIIGIILGLWRAGSRYDESLIKIGGILMIIPYLAVVGPILILIGASNVMKRMGSV